MPGYAGNSYRKCYKKSYLDLLQLNFSAAVVLVIKELCSNFRVKQTCLNINWECWLRQVILLLLDGDIISRARPNLLCSSKRFLGYFVSVFSLHLFQLNDLF